MNRRPEVVEQTRNRLMNAFCMVYAKKPFEKITVREVVQKAGCSRSNFYLYYTNLEELRTEVENEILDAIRSIMKAETVDAKTDFLSLILRLYSEHELQLAAVLGDYGSIRFQERFKKELVEAFPTVFAENKDETFPYLVEYHISTILSLFQLWLRRGKDISSEELFRIIDSLLLR